MKSSLRTLPDWLRTLMLRLAPPRTGATLMKKLLRKVGPLTTEPVANALQVRRKARQLGVNDLPESDALELDPQHQSIRNYLSKKAITLRNLVVETVTVRLQSWNLLAADFQEYDPAHLDELGRLAANESTQLIEAQRFVLQDHRKKVLTAKRELNFFKADNELYRNAVYADSRVFHFGVLALLVLLESGLNGQFFAKGSDFGLLGGTILATMISLMNVLLAIAAGNYPMRWIFSIRWGWKIAGIVLLLAYAGVVLFMNTVVGHYRALLDLDPDLAVMEAAKLAWTQRLDFGNFNALVLFLLGLIFSGLALLKTYFADDSYPGYGPVQRRFEAAQRAYQQQRANLSTRVLGGLNEALREISTCTEAFAMKLKRAAQHLAAIRYLLEAYGHTILLMDKTCLEVVQIFREENLRVRTSTAPDYFQTNVHMDQEGLELPDVGLEAANQRLQDFEHQLDAYKRSGESQKHRLDELFRQQMEQVNTLVGHLEKDADREFRQDAREEDQIRQQVSARPHPISAVNS